MKSVLSLSGVILTLNFGALPAMAGNSSGGGGDFFRIQFHAAKATAATELLRLNDERIALHKDARVKEWLKANRLALADDIFKSQHEWTGTSETCARTEFKPSPIAFSIASCARCMAGAVTPGPFAKLLIHESVHHLGVEDEAFADEVASAVFSLSLTAYTCRYAFQGAYQTLDVDSSQPHRIVEVGGSRLRFSNYEGHVYVDVTDAGTNKRRAKISLVGDYLSYYPSDLPSVYCVRQ